MGEQSCEKSESFFATVGRELLPLKLLLLTHHGARNVLFTGLAEYGGGIAFCLVLSNGNKQAHPSHDTAKPARATHTSTETKLVMPHSVLNLYAFNRSKEYLSHTLCGINCGRRLSRHAQSTQLAHHRQSISSLKYSDWVFHLSRGSRVCVWRERVYVREWVQVLGVIG